MIKYTCSDGKKVSQATIDRLRSQSYKDNDDGTIGCEGCNNRAEGHGHIVAQARCKQLGKTELIWNPANYLKACNKCNRIIEAPTSEAFTQLNCYEYCMTILEKYDPEKYRKVIEFGTKPLKNYNR